MLQEFSMGMVSQMGIKCTLHLRLLGPDGELK